MDFQVSSTFLSLSNGEQDEEDETELHATWADSDETRINLAALDCSLHSTDFSMINLVKFSLLLPIPHVDLGNLQGVNWSSKDEDPVIRALSHSLGSGLTSDVTRHQISEHDAELIGDQVTAGQHVALKRLMSTEEQESPSKKRSIYLMLRRELSLLDLTQEHPNVVNLLFIGWEKDSIVPVLGLELAAFGNLEDFLASADLTFAMHSITSYERKRITVDIMAGLQALHACGYAHGDLKPSNVLVQRDPINKLCCKLTDFCGAIDLRVESRASNGSHHGTPTWMAPEVLRAQSISDWTKCDVYSFGLLITSLYIQDCLRPGYSLMNYLVLEDAYDGQEEERVKEITDDGTLNAWEKLARSKEVATKLLAWLKKGSTASFEHLKILEDDDERSPLFLSTSLLRLNSHNMFACMIAQKTLLREPAARASMADICTIIAEGWVGERWGPLLGPAKLEEPEMWTDRSKHSVGLLSTCAKFFERSSEFQELVFEEMERKLSPCRMAWNYKVEDICGPMPTDLETSRLKLEDLNVLLHPLNPESDAHVELAELAMDVAFCYCTGQGTIRNYKQGLLWMAFCASLGNDLAMSLYQPLEDSLSLDKEDDLPRRLWTFMSSLKGFRESRKCLQYHNAADLVMLSQLMPVSKECDKSGETFDDFTSASFSCVLPTITSVADRKVIYSYLYRDGGFSRTITWPWKRWRIPESSMRTPEIQKMMESSLETALSVSLSFCEPNLVETFLETKRTTEEIIDLAEIYVGSLQIQHHSELNLRWTHGRSLAARQRYIMRLLLDDGLDPTSIILENFTPLSEAIRVDRLDDVKMMIEYLQIRVFDLASLLDDPRFFQGCTAIQRCVYNGQIDMMEYLLGLTACNLDIVFKYNGTCLHTAASQNDPRYAEILLRHGANPLLRKGDRSSPFDSAVIYGNIGTAKVLIPDALKTELLSAQNTGFTSFGKVLSAALTTHRNITTMASILFMKEIDAVDFIINTTHGSSAFHTVLQFPASLRKDYAAFERDVLEFLLSCFSGAEYIDYPDPKTGFSPLHSAVFRCNLDAVHLLIDAGADVNAETSAPAASGTWSDSPEGQTALDMTTWRRRRDPKYMLEAGARELAGWRASLEKITDLLRKNGAKSGSRAPFWDSLETQIPEIVSVSHIGPPVTGLSSFENDSFQTMGQFSPLSVDRRSRQLKYAGDWPEKYAQNSQHIEAEERMDAMTTVLLELALGSDPLPDKWTAHNDSSGRLCFVHEDTGTMTFDDPCIVTRFFEMVRTEKVEIVRQRIERGEYNASIIDHRDRHAISIAAEVGRNDMIELLLSQNDDFDFDLRDLDKRRTAVQWAAAGEHSTAIKRLEQAILAQAAARGQTERVFALLEHDSSHSLNNEAQKAALDHAAMGGHIDTVRVFMARDINPDLETLAIAIYNDHHRIRDVVLNEAQLLVEPNDKIWPQLLDQLIEADAITTIQWLLEAGLSFQTCLHDDGHTPLHTAARSGELEMVELLLSHGIDPNVQDNRGITCFFNAAAKGHIHVMEAILPHTDATRKDLLGRSVLHFAAISGSTATVELALGLLNSAEVSLNDSDHDGWSALHWASRKGEEDVVEVLLDARLVSSEEFLFNWLPSEVAESHGQLHTHGVLQHAQKEPGKYTLEDLTRSNVKRRSDVHLVCSQCELPCIFGNIYECKTCDALTLCFKCGRSCILLHPEHEFRITKRDESWTRTTFSPLEQLNHNAAEERKKYRRELGLNP
jgi:ankyrin repeat protein/serine/threonine protein kinase